MAKRGRKKSEILRVYRGFFKNPGRRKVFYMRNMHKVIWIIQEQDEDLAQFFLDGLDKKNIPLTVMYEMWKIMRIIKDKDKAKQMLLLIAEEMKKKIIAKEFKTAKEAVKYIKTKLQIIKMIDGWD
jgi:hypothetical protein